MLSNPRANTFGLTLHSLADGSRPTSGTGTALTPAQNAYGTYVELFSAAQVTDDVYEIFVMVSGVGISATSRDCLVSLSLDSGVTSLVDLVCGPAAAVAANGVEFRFPLFIPAGTRIMAAAAVNSSNLATLQIRCRLKCQPTQPNRLIIGRYIDQFGVTLASSNGTALTEGSLVDGTYVQVGGSPTRPLQYLTYGYGHSSSAINNAATEVDIAIGDATNKVIVIANATHTTTSSEAITKPDHGQECSVNTAHLLYARAQGSGGVAGASIAIYGVGG